MGWVIEMGKRRIGNKQNMYSAIMYYIFRNSPPIRRMHEDGQWYLVRGGEHRPVPNPMSVSYADATQHGVPAGAERAESATAIRAQEREREIKEARELAESVAAVDAACAIKDALEVADQRQADQQKCDAALQDAIEKSKSDADQLRAQQTQGDNDAAALFQKEGFYKGSVSVCVCVTVSVCVTVCMCVCV